MRFVLLLFVVFLLCVVAESEAKSLCQGLHCVKLSDLILQRVIRSAKEKSEANSFCQGLHCVKLSDLIRQRVIRSAKEESGTKSLCQSRHCEGLNDFIGREEEQENK